jgi:hypothetical protein
VASNRSSRTALAVGWFSRHLVHGRFLMDGPALAARLLRGRTEDQNVTRSSVAVAWRALCGPSSQTAIPRTIDVATTHQPFVSVDSRRGSICCREDQSSRRVVDKCGQATKGTWGMSWRQKALKGVEDCEKLGGAVKQALIPGFLNCDTLNP